jgi:hypothetical protein
MSAAACQRLHPRSNQLSEVTPRRAIAGQNGLDRRRRQRNPSFHRERLYHRRSACGFARAGALLLAGVGLLASSGKSAARAEPGPTDDRGIPETPPDERPWAAGVTAAQKARANELLAAGNELLVQNKYAEALQRYEDAIKVWDHPAIRANMVVCFINLGRTLDAYENAALALRHGQGPYKRREIYVETMNYAKLLDGQVVKLEIRCDEPDAFVTVDGQASVTCPGTNRQPVLPGTHQIVARKRGYLTFTRDLLLPSGGSTRVDVRLVPLEEAAITVRRWATWKPWAIAGSGAGLLLVAGAVQLRAGADMRRADAERDRLCGMGCDPRELPDRIERRESRAILENRLAVGAAIAGSAVVITGLVGAYLNRPRTILPDESGAAPLFAPFVTGRQAGLVVQGSF